MSGTLVYSTFSISCIKIKIVWCFFSPELKKRSFMYYVIHPIVSIISRYYPLNFYCDFSFSRFFLLSNISTKLVSIWWSQVKRRRGLIYCSVYGLERMLVVYNHQHSPTHHVNKRQHFQNRPTHSYVYAICGRPPTCS